MNGVACSGSNDYERVNLPFLCFDSVYEKVAFISFCFHGMVCVSIV